MYTRKRTRSSSHGVDESNQPQAIAESRATNHGAQEVNHNIAEFVSKLWQMTEDESISSIKWSKDGQTILIEPVEEFRSEVLPRFFKHENLTAFQRQLRYYEFYSCTRMARLVTKSSSRRSQKLAYGHPFFRRGHPDLLKHIVRNTRKSNSAALEEQKLARTRAQKSLNLASPEEFAVPAKASTEASAAGDEVEKARKITAASSLLALRPAITRADGKNESKTSTSTAYEVGRATTKLSCDSPQFLLWRPPTSSLHELPQEATQNGLILPSQLRAEAIRGQNLEKSWPSGRSPN